MSRWDGSDAYLVRKPLQVTSLGPKGGKNGPSPLQQIHRRRDIVHAKILSQRRILPRHSLAISRTPPSLLPRCNRILQRQADEALIWQSCVGGALAHSIIKFFGEAQID